MSKLQAKGQDLKQQAMHLNLLSRHRDALQKITLAIETNPAVAEYHVLRCVQLVFCYLHWMGFTFKSLGPILQLMLNPPIYIIWSTDHTKEIHVVNYTGCQRPILLWLGKGWWKLTICWRAKDAGDLFYAEQQGASYSILHYCIVSFLKKKIKIHTLYFFSIPDPLDFFDFFPNSKMYTLALFVKFSEVPWTGGLEISMQPLMTICWLWIRRTMTRTAKFTSSHRDNFCLHTMISQLSASPRSSTRRRSSCSTRPSRGRREKRGFTSTGEVSEKKVTQLYYREKGLYINRGGGWWEVRKSRGWITDCFHNIIYHIITIIKLMWEGQHQHCLLSVYMPLLFLIQDIREMVCVWFQFSLTCYIPSVHCCIPGHICGVYIKTFVCVFQIVSSAKVIFNLHLLITIRPWSSTLEMRTSAPV